MKKGRSSPVKRSLLYYLRRLYLDPGWFFSLILIVIFLFVGLLVFSTLGSGQTTAPENYLNNLKSLYEQAFKKFSLSGSLGDQLRLAYAETLLNHNVKSGIYAVYGYECLLGENDFINANAYRFLTLVPAISLAFGAFLAYVLFYSKGSRSAEKNAFEAHLERRKFRLGGYLCYFLLVGLVCLLFDLLSLTASFPRMALVRFGDGFVYLPTFVLLLIKMIENLLVSLAFAFIPLGVFLLVKPDKRAFFGMLINFAMTAICAYLSILSFNKTGAWLYFPFGGIPLSIGTIFSRLALILVIGGLAYGLLKFASKIDKSRQVN